MHGESLKLPMYIRTEKVQRYLDLTINITLEMVRVTAEGVSMKNVLYVASMRVFEIFFKNPAIHFSSLKRMLYKYIHLLLLSYYLVRHLDTNFPGREVDEVNNCLTNPF